MDQVIDPTIPSTLSRFAAWKARTALSVTGPNCPSTLNPRADCKYLTASPVEPLLNAPEKAGREEVGAGAAATGAGVAAGAVPEIVNTRPTRIKFALVIPFKAMMFAVVVPNLEAMRIRVSPGATV